jgi:OOP family OmpA-OmpF porin
LYQTAKPSSTAAAAAAQPPAATKVTYAADAFFDFDKSVLKPEGKAKLDDLVDKVKGINLEVVIAVGHTDSVGDDAKNLTLSQNRANSVMSALIKRGVDPTRMEAVGFGETKPIASNSTAAGKAENRRTEFKVIAR